MQSNHLPFLERNFFHEESRAARWGVVGLFASGAALFLALFVIMLAISLVVGHTATFIKLLFGSVKSV